MWTEIEQSRGSAYDKAVGAGGRVVYLAPGFARCGGSGATFGYVWSEATRVLEAMAEAGGGTFSDLLTDDRGDPPDGGTPSGSPYECDSRIGDCGTP